jgi:hypothetical protein
MADLFIGLTVLMVLVFLYYMNTVMNRHRKPEGYNPKPQVPYESQRTLSQPIYQDQLIRDNSGVVVGKSSGVTNIYYIKYEKSEGQENSEREKIPFKLIRRDSSVKVPFESKTALEVSHPEKTIENCRLIYDGKELIAEESNLPHVTIIAQGSALFRIPLGMEKEEALVTVKTGERTIKEEKLKDVEYPRSMPLGGSTVPKLR